MAARRSALERLLDWCAIPSVSRDERGVADAVGADLADLGLAVSESDPVGDGNAGNLYARLEPTGAGTPILLCAHLDTVPLADVLEPVVDDDGMVTNRAPTILGADDKVALATMITAVERVVADGLPHPGIELLLTVQEEIGLRGAKAHDASTLRARAAFVYDVEGPVGEVIVAAPSQRSIDAQFTGRAAHAGMSPELGRSAILAAARAIAAMPHGRIDPETTANVGTISGGSARNAVAARASFQAEIRSLGDAALHRELTRALDAITDAANATEVDVATNVLDEYRAYRHRPDAPILTLAEEALRSVGAEPRRVPTGGGADAHILNAAGIPSINLAFGCTGFHSADERVPAADLDRMVDVTLAIVEGARRGIG
jgi:tripeptide aminopeptidase